MNSKTDEWDVFLSHASEDKDAVARPLAEQLIKLGVKVWFDEFELKVGDSLSRSLDKGLSKSAKGIVILSKNFMRKDWPEFELRGLVAKAQGRDKNILPVWFNITREELVEYSPSLSDVIAERGDQGIEALALKLLRAIKPDLHEAVRRRVATNLAVSRSTVTNFDISKLHHGPRVHETLPQNLVNRIANIRVLLKDLEPGSIEKWISDFQRDFHPSREILIWENIVGNFYYVQSKTRVSKSERRILYNMLLLASLEMRREAAREILKLGSKRANEIIGHLNDRITEFGDVDEEAVSKMLLDRGSDLEMFNDGASEIDEEIIGKITDAIKSLGEGPLRS